MMQLAELLTTFQLKSVASLRSMAILSNRAQESRSAPISSRFLCPRPPLLVSAPNQNRHATEASL